MLHTNVITEDIGKAANGTAKAGPKPPAILRLFPSLTDLAFLSPLLLLLLTLNGVNTMLGDGDSGWHIRTGEWILTNGKVPTQDLFSYTMSTSPWFAWEWLADIIMAVAHQKFGLAGPVYVGILTLCVTSVLLFRLSCRHTNNNFLAIAITGIALSASSVHWLARPHLYTLLFLAVSLHILERAKTNPKLLWIFPPMVALWANLHGAFLIAPVILITIGIGNFLEEITSPEDRPVKDAFSKATTYLVVGVVSMLASILNPYGIELHKHIYQYLSESYHFDNIMEFQSISFHSSYSRYFEILIVLGLFAVAWSVAKRRFADALLLLSWLHLSLVSGRNIPLYVFIAAPVITRFLSEGLMALKDANVAGWITRLAAGTADFGSEFSSIDRIPRLHLVSMAASAILFLMMVGAPADSKKLKAEYDTKVYPSGALKLLAGKHVFTNDEWGDYLIYKLYPEQKVFVDGRSDFYGPKFGLKYIDVINGHWDWASTLAKYDVDAILLPAASALATTLKTTPGWKVVHDDHISILFFATGETIPGSPVGKSSLNHRSEFHNADPVAGLVLESSFAPTPQHQSAQAIKPTLKEVM